MPRQGAVLVQGVNIRKATLTVLVEYKGYADVFSKEKASMLLELGSAKHAIKTIADLLFRLLYNLSAVQLKALQEYLDNALGQG